MKVTSKPSGIEMILSGNDEAYMLAAFRKCNPREVGGVFRITREEEFLTLHTPEVLKQKVTSGSCDFEDAIQDWLLTWNKSEAVFAKEPNLDFGLWHTHPCTGWSYQDETWIKNYTNSGLLVSIVFNCNDVWETRVDTLLGGFQFTRPGEMYIDHPAYDKATKKAHADCEARVTVDKKTYHMTKKAKKRALKLLHDHKNDVLVSGYTPDELRSLVSGDSTFKDQPYDEPALLAAPTRKVVVATAGVVGDGYRHGQHLGHDAKQYAAEVFRKSSDPKVYFPDGGLFSGVLRTGNIYLMTIPLKGATNTAKENQELLRSVGITNKMLTSYLDSGTLLEKNVTNHWTARKL